MPLGALRNVGQRARRRVIPAQANHLFSVREDLLYSLQAGYRLPGRMLQLSGHRSNYRERNQSVCRLGVFRTRF